MHTVTIAPLMNDDPLDFGADPAITARVRDELAETLAVGDASRRTSLRSALDERDFHAEFAGDVGNALAFGSRNLADVMAAYWLVMWTVVHDAELPSIEDARPVRAQVGRVLASSPLARDPANRQAMGEAMLSETVLTREQQRNARERGDADALKRMAETAQHNMLMRQALNLKKTRLTRSGLVR